MPSIADRIAQFVRGQRGQQLMAKVRQYASRPETQRRIVQFRDRIAGGRRRPRRP